MYAEDPALTQIRLGCRSVVSPLLRRCNFNVETGSKQISIVGVSPQETAIDCGLSYDSDCPNERLRPLNANGLPVGAIPRRGLHLAGGSSSEQCQYGSLHGFMKLPVGELNPQTFQRYLMITWVAVVTFTVHSLQHVLFQELPCNMEGGVDMKCSSRCCVSECLVL